MKKPIYKKWWFWVIVVIVLAAVLAPGDNGETEDNEASAAVSDNEDSTFENTPVGSTVTEPENTTEDEPLTFELVAGEKGEYGEMFTMNKDTEFEENYYIYRIPVGTYTVTNAGEYMNQVTVCSDETVVTEDGWEECADVPYAKSFKVGESDTVTVAEGYYIEIHEPAKFSFVLTSGEQTHD